MGIARLQRRGFRRAAGTTVAILSTVALCATPAVAQDFFGGETEELGAQVRSDASMNVESHAGVDENAEGYDSFIVSYKETEPAKVEIPRSIIYEELYKAGMHKLEEKDTATDAKVVKTDKKLSKAEAEEFMSEVRATGAVEYIEPDVSMHIMGETNDKYSDRQWSMRGDNSSYVEDAWELAPSRGQGEVVAVIDSGITDHPDLRDNLVDGWDFVSNAATARDGDGRDSDPQDEGDWFYRGECNQNRDVPSSWHGTHVAGIIAATADNYEGIAGAAPNAQIQPIRALGKCGGRLSDIADAVVWASGGHVPGVPENKTPAKIINMSLGGNGQCSRYYQEAIDIAVSNGSTVIVAAGNENQNAGNVQPASCNNVITVGATGDNGARAGYSNFGWAVDVSAPGGDMDRGEGILSTVNSGQTRPTGPGYAFYQGTSMATPLVSAVAALMRTVDDSLTSDRIEDVLKDTTYRQPVSCWEGCGTGIVDAWAAVKAVGGRENAPKPTTYAPVPAPKPTTSAPAPRPTTSAPAPRPTPTPTPNPTPQKPRNPFYDYFQELIGRR